MDQGWVYGNCGYEGILSYEEFEQKNLILWMIKNQLAVWDVKLAWDLKLLEFYSDNLWTYDWIECKYNPQITVLDHSLQKDGEDFCLHCAFIIIALHFKREYSGIIKPNTNLNIFLKKIKLRKSVFLQPSRLKKYNQRMEKEGKIVSLLDSAIKTIRESMLW
ncbi:unnamed protein product [Blepharisma stoltei]|uniref:Uncharacterized protein n=1 Tax=Blepharisma stoltei TaxID=1481888 RepID=A0AAU9ITA9_9CILI|nr:unnamed protein product [Blepharisma stoltei]